MGEEKFAELLKDRDALKKILTYHIVPSKLLTKDALALARKMKPATTVHGGEITLAIKGSGVMKGLYLNDEARVGDADVIASNGVIHVIDKVLVPPK